MPMGNFTAIRNGLREHIRQGKMPPFDLGVYTFLHMHCNYGNGIYQGCAMTIACNFGDPKLKEHVQKSLRRLREKGYINFRKGDGKRHGYPILIDKYDVVVGEQSGKRLNAWRHSDLVKPEYEFQIGRGTVVERKSHGHETVVAPIQDLKTQDVQDSEPLAPNGAAKRGTRIPENFTVTDNHRAFAIENGLPTPETEVEKFKDHFRAAVGSAAVKKDWDATFRNWLRRASEMKRKGNGYGYESYADRRESGNLASRESARAAVMDR